MDEKTYYLWSLILWAAALLGVIATVVVYILQWLAMRATIKAQNLASLIQYMQSNDVREARYKVSTDLKTKNDQDKSWSADDEKDAATALAAYDIAAIMVKTKSVKKNIIYKGWGHSILRICEVCKEFIHSRRITESFSYSALLEIEEEVREFMGKQKPPKNDSSKA